MGGCQQVGFRLGYSSQVIMCAFVVYLMSQFDWLNFVPTIHQLVPTTPNLIIANPSKKGELEFFFTNIQISNALLQIMTAKGHLKNRCSGVFGSARHRGHVSSPIWILALRVDFIGIIFQDILHKLCSNTSKDVSLFHWPLN